MFYEKRITVPANTPEADQVSVELAVHPGTVEQVEISFPKGCAGLVGLRIFYWEHQVWPTNLEEVFRADGETIHFNEDFELPGAPFLFQIRAFNQDDTYQHQPIVRLKIAPFGTTFREIFTKQFGMGPTGPITNMENG